MSAPTIAAFLPVEDILISGGYPDARRSLYRCFTDLYASHFPARARLVVVMVLLGGSGQFVIQSRLRDPASQVIADTQGETITAVTMHTHTFVFNDLVLPTPGTYILEGVIEGAVMISIPLIVSFVQPKVEAAHA
jgi:hypothetical protein